MVKEVEEGEEDNELKEKVNYKEMGMGLFAKR